MKNRLLVLFLAATLIFSHIVVTPARAESNNMPSEETIERVKEEVLSGNITSTQDVLDVAMMQRSASTTAIPTSYNMRSASHTNASQNESLQIRQVIESTENADGTWSGVVASTGLLLVDENGRSVSAAEYEYYRMSDTEEEGNLDSYQIYATQTIYIIFRFLDPEFNTATLEIEHMITTLTYDSSKKATKMRQIYAGEADYYSLDYIIEEQDWIFNPSAGSHLFTPSNARPLPIGMAQLQGQAEIYYGSTQMTIATILPTSAYQFNKDFGILLEGWS